MTRLALLVAISASASAFGQTADVLREVTGGVWDPVRQRTISTVTYDLTKIVKGNRDLNTTDKVLGKLADYGIIRAPGKKGEPGDPVTIQPKNRITVRASLAAHDEIQDQLNVWASKPAPAPPELPNARPVGALPPPGLLPPPGNFGLPDDIRRKLLEMAKPDKKKR